MPFAEKLKNDVTSGYSVTKADCEKLLAAPLNELCGCADEIRKFFCSDKFDICAISSGKSGKCSEDCKFCAQSSHYKTKTVCFPMRSGEEIFADAHRSVKEGANRFGIVTSGRALSGGDFDTLRDVCGRIKRAEYRIQDGDNNGAGKYTDAGFGGVNFNLCASCGLLEFEQLEKLKSAGVTRYHCNIETSRRFFPFVCTTHTYADKIRTIKNAQKAGLDICSGVILGLGENDCDRLDAAFELRGLGVKSVPVNILNPIPGTPLGDNKKLPYGDVLRTAAIFRFILPDAFIRLAGGRIFLPDYGARAFSSGVNAAISGNMLTTEGPNIKSDIRLIKNLGFET